MLGRNVKSARVECQSRSQEVSICRYTQTSIDGSADKADRDLSSEEILNAIIKEPITELLQLEHSIWIDPNNRVGDGFLHVGESMRRARRNDDHVALRDAAADAAANAAASESRTELLHNIARRFAFLRIHECSAGHKCSGAFDYVVDLRNFFMRGHPREVCSFVAMHNRDADIVPARIHRTNRYVSNVFGDLFPYRGLDVRGFHFRCWKSFRRGCLRKQQHDRENP